MPTYANRVAGFGTTIFTEINNLARQHDAVNLGQGKPDFAAPPSIIAAAVDAMQSGQTDQYAPGIGVPELRQAISDHTSRFYGMTVDPDRGVVVTSGASEGLFTAVLGLVDPGDEIILLEPYFDLYLPAIQMAGGVPVYVPMRPPDWTFDPDELRAAFTDRTRAIIINTPHNPTGRVFNHEELLLIAELCQKHDTLVISDEVYEHLAYEGSQHVPIASLPGMFERVVTVSSAAKTFSVTGWKVGWVYGHPDLITGVWRVHQNVTFAVNHPAQVAVAYALNQADDYYRDYLSDYRARRDLMMQILDSTGLKADPPQGAFYVMADFSDVFDGNDVDFARYLIAEIGVACIPPSTFFSEPHKAITSRHVRFAFCKEHDTLYAAGDKMARLRA